MPLNVLPGMGLLGSWALCITAMWPVAKDAGVGLVAAALAQLAAGAVGTLLMAVMADELSRSATSRAQDDDKEEDNTPRIDSANACASVWALLVLVTGFGHFAVAYSLTLLSMGDATGALTMLLPTGGGDNRLLYYMLFNFQMIDSLLWACLCGVFLLPPYIIKALQHLPGTTAVKTGYATLAAAGDSCC